MRCGHCLRATPGICRETRPQRRCDVPSLPPFGGGEGQGEVGEDAVALKCMQRAIGECGADGTTPPHLPIAARWAPSSPPRRGGEEKQGVPAIPSGEDRSASRAAKG